MNTQEKVDFNGNVTDVKNRIGVAKEPDKEPDLDQSYSGGKKIARRASAGSNRPLTKPEELEELLIQLVEVRSVVSSDGEHDVIDFIEDYVRGWEYFRARPEQVVRIPSAGDPLGRSSLLVCVSGHESNDTIVLLGHTDTVEVDDYGLLVDLATTPDRLEEALRSGQRHLYAQARADLESGEYRWGRGTLDMKAGVANELMLLRRLAGNPDSFRGHVIALFVCDEEGNSAGMISATDVLRQWRDTKGLEIIGVVNTDYHTAQYPGDEAYYLFRGTVGKIMPIFYIRTLETHAGDPFAGLDANLVLVELISEINLNPKYSDYSGDEISVPPITLKVEDLKKVYSVKTNHEAWTLISVPLFEQTPADVMRKMLEAANIAAEKSLSRYYRYQREYNRLACIPTETIHPSFEVIVLAELIDRVASQFGEESDHLVDRYLAPILNETDTREQTLHLIRQLELLLPDRRPRIVIGFAPPFYPAVSCAGSDDVFYQLVDQGIRAAINRSDRRESVATECAPDANCNAESLESDGSLSNVAQGSDLAVEIDSAKDGPYLLDNGKELKVKTYYPYISDLSYLALPYTDNELHILQDNMPTLGRSYHVPLQTMKALDLPVINLGAYGFDAHKWTERVERDYSLRILPELLQGIVMEILGV
ncbi:MAG TPA: M20/M25/M40 family metallo-hydrolase [Clostridiaceae bacterium]|nr:M20/M25/M40 family metallo-hydrolase [Clostridiaceae bacterium]